MNETSITQYITGTFTDIHVFESNGNNFYYCGPYEGVEHKFPFATLVTSDEYDQFSNLNRPGVFRLNIGVSKATFQSLFGTKAEVADKTYDFTALDQLMPHPVYGMMYWLSVLNPSAETFETVKTLLAEAYAMDAQKQARRSGN